MPGECRSQHGRHTNGVLIDVRLDILRADGVLPRHNPRLNIETKLGLAVDFPAASRRFRQFHFNDKAPSMIASDEP